MDSSSRMPGAPTDVPGTVQATWRDAPRVCWWQVRGWTYGTARAVVRRRPAAALRNAFLAVVGILMLLLLIPAYAVVISGPRARYYLDEERSAVLGVVATKRSWLIQDHASAHPGSGAGAELRTRLLPKLLPAADRLGVPIVLETSVPELGAIYQEDIPGLHPSGRSRMGRAVFRRDPGGERAG